MHWIDWLVMLSVLLGIVAYGVWKTRSVANVKSYLLGDKDLKWWTIGLSVMATQASAITFLSTPGQAFDDGMRFAQFYFGLPVAMVILCVFVLPLYYRLNVYTAYEYLEGRFGIKTRTLTAILFLISRGLAAGITIYAPAIILSNIMGWDLNITILLMGVLVIFYTVAGGTKAVSVTQKQQMIVILGGMFIAAVILVLKLPADVSFDEAVGVAGKMGKLNVVDFEFDLSNRYNFWSGMLGGVFLFLSYFGTDQSQVQRYLSGKSLAESRLGLLFNGIVKVPMQFLVLFVGILVFVFYQFTHHPVHFNKANVEIVQSSEYAEKYDQIEEVHTLFFDRKEEAIQQLIIAQRNEDETAIDESKTRIQKLLAADKFLKSRAESYIKKAKGDSDKKEDDTDYVFISFVTNHLPVGLIGILLAVIFSAAMSSTASELNALATTSVIDIYKRSIKKHESDKHYFTTSKWMTILWGGIALLFASFAGQFDNLIEAVNIVGSLFYGTILGIFLVAFFFDKLGQKSLVVGTIFGAILGAVVVGLFKGQLGLQEAIIGGLIGAALSYLIVSKTFISIGGRAVFIGALIAEIFVVSIYILNEYGYIEIAYLWLNLIGCVLVFLFSWVIQQMIGKPKEA